MDVFFTLLSWMSFFGSIKPNIRARLFGYLYYVYFQFFIYFCESVFLEIIIQNKVSF